MSKIDDVSREVKKLLEQYQKLVLKWNHAINLISKNSSREFWLRHIVDSLQLLKYIDDKNISIIDVGSGAGLPGIVLSIAGVKEVTLIESDERKCMFLFQASKISPNKVKILNKRVEDVYLECDILTSRAFASLDKIFSYTKNIKVKNKYLLLKGENYLQEFKSECKVHDSITSKKGKILECPPKLSL